MGGRWCIRVQRWRVAVAMAVPRDWPNNIMFEGAMERERGEDGTWEFLGFRPVRKERMDSASVVSPASVGKPLLRPKPR